MWLTASSKTLAFLLPVLERLLKREDPLTKQQVGAIIIGPTRELAEQIHGVLERLLAPLDGALSSLLLIGGTKKVAQDLGNWPPPLLLFPAALSPHGPRKSAGARVGDTLLWPRQAGFWMCLGARCSTCTSSRCWCSTRPTASWTWDSKRR